MERVASLETRASTIERLQDALDQMVGLLNDRRERQVDRYGGRIELLKDQTARLHNNVSPTPQLVNIQSFLQGVEVIAAGVLSPQRIETLQTKILELDHGLERLQSSSIDQELRL